MTYLASQDATALVLLALSRVANLVQALLLTWVLGGGRDDSASSARISGNA